MNNRIDKKATAVILAAGRSTRMGTGVSKHLISISGDTVLCHSIRAFEEAESVSSIIVVAREDELHKVKELTSSFPKVVKIVPGGESRGESARLGFLAVPRECELVAIHDAARCLVTPDMVNVVVSAAILHGAATAGVPVYDTVKLTDDERYVVDTLSRDRLFLAATPQVFSREQYARALDFASDYEAKTDDNAVLEAIGTRIYPVDTGRNNIKITTCEDVEFAEFILSKRSHGVTNKKMAYTDFRIGHGYDVHRLVEGRDMIIGGVKIEYDLGILGHSDADVLLHAIMDAMLGAGALGDIGRHFPDSDEQYRGISSLELLKKVNAMIQEAGYRVGNVDSTVILQAPKLAPHVPQMIDKISEALEISSDCISIKATTEEGLGFTGDGRGIAAHALVLLKK